MTIHEFETEIDDCLEIRDGHSEGASLIGAFCGMDAPTSIQTTQSNVWMRQVESFLCLIIPSETKASLVKSFSDEKTI